MPKVLVVAKPANNGRIYYYPIGKTKNDVLRLIRKKTLSELEIECFRALGCTVEVVPFKREKETSTKHFLTKLFRK